MQFHLSAIAALLLLICVSFTVSHETKKTLQGHLRPLGEQGPVLPVDEVEGFLKPKEFVEKYVLKNKPLLMRGAGKVSPAWEKWTDKYLSEKAPPSPEGDVYYETGKKEDRSGQGGTMHMREFIAKYNTSDIYMVHDIPGWMMPDLTLPAPLQCEGFLDGGLDTTVMWFSSGGTKSVLHQDSYENINCIYRGSKTLVFINSTKYKDLVPKLLTKPDGAYNDKIDVDKIDLEKYPVFSGLEYHIGHMHPGDCLYIPFLWIHQVRSSDESNLAVNVWWTREKTQKIDLNKCNKELNPAWSYDKVEWVNTEQVQNNLELMKDFRKTLKANVKSKPLDEEGFTQFVVEGCELIKENESAMKMVKEMFSLLDKNHDKKLDLEDFKLKKEKLKFLSKLLNRGTKFDNHLYRTIEKFPDKCQGLYIYRVNEEVGQDDSSGEGNEEDARDAGEEPPMEGGEEDMEEFDVPHDEL